MNNTNNINTLPALNIAPKAVLFDFDGTLADTAPDLVEATQRILDRQGLPRLPYETLRTVCSSGAKGLLGVALNVTPADATFEPLRQQFLAEYRACLTQHTRLFDGVAPLLQALNQAGIAWGIVTNKATDLTTPIVQAILLDAGLPPATVVCGDTTPYAKPHPAPLLKACADMGLPPQACWYVGDDRRDIESALAAQCLPIAVSYGYHADTDPPQSWGAALTLDAPQDLLSYVLIHETQH
jgi:N-acetyl-D-muramate 6-phosphate phosphatase